MICLDGRGLGRIKKKFREKLPVVAAFFMFQNEIKLPDFYEDEIADKINTLTFDFYLI